MVQREKETVVTIAWRSCLGVSRSGCAILCLEGEERLARSRLEAVQNALERFYQRCRIKEGGTFAP
jgi:hypothetical protein